MKTFEDKLSPENKMSSGETEFAKKTTDCHEMMFGIAGPLNGKQMIVGIT